LAILISACGPALVRRQGTGVWRRARRRLEDGEVPGREAIDGVLLLIAGGLLTFPGARSMPQGDPGLPLMAQPSADRPNLAKPGADSHNASMSADEIDAYLDALEEPKRSSLSQLRQAIVAVLPDADEGISYGMPAFKVKGKTIAGFAAFKNHLSYLPHSGSVFPELAEELAGYSRSTGSLRFAIDTSLPAEIVEKLIAVRLRQALPD
jgi:uncharacterized protein YdhG (YjbR/CyaY superfamily)